MFRSDHRSTTAANPPLGAQKIGGSKGECEDALASEVNTDVVKSLGMMENKKIQSKLLFCKNDYHQQKSHFDMFNKLTKDILHNGVVLKRKDEPERNKKSRKLGIPQSYSS